MSDIKRGEFEQAVTDNWSDIYSFTRFGDEDFCDEVLEGMWFGWQASRQTVSVPGGVTETQLDAIWKAGFDAENYSDRDYCDVLTLARNAIEEATPTKADECCTWLQDDADYAWSGDCGIYWSFEDGGPKDNCVKFCPNCGKPCVSIELEEEQDDE